MWPPLLLFGRSICLNLIRCVRWVSCQIGGVYQSQITSRPKGPYIYIVDKSKCLLYSCKIEKPHTLCNVCNVQCFKTILWWSASFQSTRNRGNLPYDYETAIFRNHSPRVSPKSFSQSQRPPGPTSSKWLETCCQLTANRRQDCGAKTDALGEWRGSTKFGGEPLGEKTPKRTTEATWKTWLIGWLYNCLS